MLMKDKPLIRVCKNGNENIIQPLITHEANVYYENYHKNIFLIVACTNSHDYKAKDKHRKYA
ncbi:hypothetical protein PIROE2DRAFT_4303 [Piromyces sp. E2]|nr:hypothetical protein PIROE2DRAFT_4303 [Piromyces sp. E2]|eukprot:OUM68153.1 hypothetical protein PIROE2DRAFT_4303 [Piromyces sp. E2]